VLDLNELQNVEMSQVQRRRIAIADFPGEYKVKHVRIIQPIYINMFQPKFMCIYGANVYYVYRDYVYFEIAIIDLKYLSWTHIYQLKNQLFHGRITDMFVDNNELMLLVTEKDLVKISATTRYVNLSDY
jgi:hypothetical protein